MQLQKINLFLSRSDLHPLHTPENALNQNLNMEGETREKACLNPTCISVFSHLESSRAWAAKQKESEGIFPPAPARCQTCKEKGNAEALELENFTKTLP